MSDNALLAIIFCAMLASCHVDGAIKAYKEVNRPHTIETVRPTP